MAVITRLLGKLRRQPQTLEEQIAALNRCSEESLAAIALGEEERSLRAAATTRLSYSRVLTNLAFTDDEDAVLQQAARQRIAELLDDEIVSFQQFSDDNDDPITLLSVLGFCRRPELLLQIIDSTVDTKLLYQVAVKGETANLRQLAAERIDDEATLKQLLKEAKGKDKAVYKIVKKKCDSFKERDRLIEATQVEILKLCEQIEAHSKRHFDKLFAASTEQLKRRWQQLESDATAVIGERVRRGLDQCLHVIEESAREQAEREAQALAVANAHDNQRAIIAELRGLLVFMYAQEIDSGETEEGICIQVANCSQRWADAERFKSAVPEDKKAYVQLVDGIHFQRQQVDQFGSFIQHKIRLEKCSSEGVDKADHDAGEDIGGTAENDLHQSLKLRLETARLLPEEELPQSVEDARVLLACREKQQAEQKAAVQSLLRHCGALIRKANAAIDNGQSRQAAGIRRALEEKLPELGAVPGYLSSQLEQLDEKLDKLLDWKRYVVEPKKVQLIDQMEALVASRDTPDVLATKIKRLQDEWKGLSKGTQDQVLWESFHELAQTAYQPCKVYYDEQASIRQENIEKRMGMVVQLKEYITAQPWDSEEKIDWGVVQSLIYTAIKEWRSYAPVDRGANKPVQLDFNGCLDTIRGHLNQHYQKNNEAKQRLIEKVQALASYEDNRSAVEEVKRLQALWKNTGISSRKDDQQLWKTFRAGCDAVFEKRQQLAAEFKLQLSVNKDKAVTLTQEVRELSALSGQALLDAKGRVAECQRAFKALGSLPRAKAGAIHQAFFASVDLFEETVKKQVSVERQRCWFDLLEAANKVRLSQVETDESESVRLAEEAKAFLAHVEKWPKQGLATIEKKIAMGAGSNTLDENERALRLLCIQAEIISGRQTPADDKSLRMEFQVKCLEKGLGQNRVDETREIDKLWLEWVAVGPVSTKVYDSLAERFKRSRA